MDIFKQIDKADDYTRQHANALYAPDGWKLMHQLKKQWFAAGVQDATIGKPPVQMWNSVYMTGYHAQMTIKAALTEVAL